LKDIFSNNGGGKHNSFLYICRQRGMQRKMKVGKISHILQIVLASAKTRSLTPFFSPSFYKVAEAVFRDNITAHRRSPHRHRCEICEGEAQIFSFSSLSDATLVEWNVPFITPS
jgi:hypothetical protein